MKIMQIGNTIAQKQSQNSKNNSKNVAFGLSINPKPESLISFIDTLAATDRGKCLIFNNIKEFLAHKTNLLPNLVKSTANEINPNYFSDKKIGQIIPDYSRRGIEISNYSIKTTEQGDSISVKTKVGNFDGEGVQYFHRGDIEGWEYYYVLIREAITSGISDVIGKAVQNNPKFVQAKQLDELVKADPKAAWSSIKNEYKVR